MRRFVLHGLVSQGFEVGISIICVRRTQSTETDLDYRVNKHKIAKYAYDYCKINVEYKLSYQIRCHFPSNQLTNTLPLDHGCNFSGMLYIYSVYMYIYQLRLY
jgi:hypothetical protein